MSNDKFLIVGTAGHIDHGKTSLVEALTSKNTDRLKEEKERGISIDIDFAPLKYSDGTLIGIVDVPGHEKFIKNMVAGAAGIDVALLVIDVNEGMKPQTYEHIEIIQLLGIKQGVVVLTKADLADQEFVEVSSEIIKEELIGTIFENSPFIVTSIKNGMGLSELKNTLKTLVDECPHKNTEGNFRLPIDKVFSINGFGTVVSGTIWNGTIHAGDIVELLPRRKKTKIRGIQVHGKTVDQAFAGQRAAINLTGIDRDEINRGFNLVTINTLYETRLLDVHLDNCVELVKHRQDVHFHLGTAEAFGKLLLLEHNETDESCYAQILLQKPIVCNNGDNFVIRGKSPLRTLAGGKVINPTPDRLHRRKKAEIIENLKNIENGTTQDDTYLKLTELMSQIEEVHHKHRFSNYVSRSLFDKKLIATALEWGWLITDGPGVRLPDWKVTLSSEEEKMLETIMETIHHAWLDPCDPEVICATFPKRDRIAKSLFFYAVEQGELIDIGQNKYVYAPSVDCAWRELEDLDEWFTLGEAREYLETNRKSALALLEYFDSKGITKRVDDKRTIIKHYDYDK